MFHTFGITCLNPDEEGDCFVEDFIGTVPCRDKHQEFADYLTENYIRFPPKLWKFLSSSLQLPVNVFQSFHSH